MLSSFFSIVSFLTAMKILSLPVLAQSLNATGIVVNNITYGGTGCPQGSLSFLYVPSDTRGVAVFSGYTSSIGTNISLTESRKNCQINLDIEYPDGIQYSPVSISYSGYANLDAGVEGVHNTIYYFSGSSDQVSTNHTFSGPTSEAYNYTESIDPTDTDIWSPCNSSLPLNINNQVRLTQDSTSIGNGLLYDAGIVDLALQWRSC